MENSEKNTSDLLARVTDLENQLFEANSIIDAIKQGEVDALVLTKDGKPHIYSMESADYTYRILIEKFGEGALSISDEGLILYCNDYFSKLTGIASGKITGTFFHSYVDSVTEFRSLKAALLHGPSKGEIVLNIDGNKIPVYVSLTDLKPNVAAIGVVVTDLSEKRKNEDALIKYQRQLEVKVGELNQTNANLEQFIHVISHDLKEPIRKILTYTNFLTERQPEQFTDEQQATLNIVNTSAIRLDALVDDLVKYAFVANIAEESEINIETVIDEVRDDLELVIKERKTKFVVAALPNLIASKVQMRQLFSNLISNAIKYSQREIDPEITITAAVVKGIDLHAPDREFQKISVADNGIGMEEMYLNKIFTIFQRLHMRNEYSGNGIGLAICKKIMENHNGKIEVQSAIGKGSIFNLYFPINRQ